jgi:hypothetical protein
MGPRVIPIPSGAARCCGSRLLRLGPGSPWRRRIHSYAGPSAGQIRLVNGRARCAKGAVRIGHFRINAKGAGRVLHTRLAGPSKNTCGPCRPPTASPNCKPSSTNSAPTTTPSAHTGHSTGEHPNKPLTLAPKPSPPATTSRRTTESATTASTPPASSPSATTAGCTTSASASTAPAPKSPCSSTTSTSACSTATPEP